MSAFPSPTGVTYYELHQITYLNKYGVECFRPQQGLLIMNSILKLGGNIYEKFPSPTGVTYYEYTNGHVR